MSELRFRKEGTPFIYIRWRENGKRYEKSTGIHKNDKKSALDFKKIFDAELLLKKRDAFNEFHNGDTSLDIAFEHFLRNNKGKNKKTIAEYKHFYSLLIQRFNKEKNCLQLSKLRMEEWLTEVKDWKLAQNSKHNICKLVKKFLSFLFEYNYYPHAYIINKDVLTPMQQTDIIIFSDKEKRKLLRSLKKKNSNFRTLIYLLLYTGLRPSDIITIECENINFKKNIYKYYSNKAKKYRYRPINPDLIPILKDRVKEIKTGQLLQYSSIDQMGMAFRRYLDALKLRERGFTLRTFRKTFTSDAFDQDVDPNIVAELQGHSPATAAKHYRVISTRKLQEEMNKITILGNKRGQSGGNKKASK